KLDGAIEASARHGGRCRVEYRLAPLANQVGGKERSVSVVVTVHRDGTGQLVRWLGITRDITERKKAEMVLAERTMQLALAGKAALVGSYAYDANSDTYQIDEGYAALHGLPEGTRCTTRSEWKTRVHPEDLDRLLTSRRRAFLDHRREYDIEYRIVRLGGEV